MDQVIWEGLRKYPALSFLDRVAQCDYTVAKTGLVIEKGTPVYISLLGLHYDPEHFPNPDLFDPERFNAENKRKYPPFSYLPFGDGPHNCIGKTKRNSFILKRQSLLRQQNITLHCIFIRAETLVSNFRSQIRIG